MESKGKKKFKTKLKIPNQRQTTDSNFLKSLKFVPQNCRFLSDFPPTPAWSWARSRSERVQSFIRLEFVNFLFFGFLVIFYDFYWYTVKLVWMWLSCIILGFCCLFWSRVWIEFPFRVLAIVLILLEQFIYGVIFS